jgi:2-methylcitrate dehydratase PrpD
VKIVSITAKLAKHAVETPFERFDASVVQRARNRVIDVVGCTIGGANAPGCSMIMEMMREWGGEKQSTILGHGGKLPAHNAAMVNAVMARSYDFEPAGPLVDGKSTPAHVSGTTVPAAIAVAEQKDASGKELLTALILGDDISSRIIAASNLDLDSGFESTGIGNMFGATAIAGRLLGLSEHQMANAFGIALNQVAGTFQNIFDGSHCFKLPQGLAARGGIFSANLAAKGFTSVKEFLTGKYGYFPLYCKTYRPEVVIKDLGERFYADNSFKPYPCCRSNHSAIDCVLDLIHENDIRPRDIDKVEVDVSPKGLEFVTGQPFSIGDVPQVSATFSLQYTVASALVRRSMNLEHFTEESIRDPKVMDLVTKIRLTGTLPPEKPLAACVKVTMKQGMEYTKRVDMPRGNDTSTPLSKAEKREKFFDNVSFSKIIPLKDAEEAFSMLDRLEDIDHVGRIVKLLVQR